MGPLSGYKVVELAGIGPGPFCAMMLADMGAEVIRIERKGSVPRGPARFQVMNRGRDSISLDLKTAEGREAVLRLVDQADALIEGYRPGVTERLGLGPDDCMGRNPKLVYGRVTGWGQDGPLAHVAGHDINYISLAGALHPIGRRNERPVPPLNLIGDFGGGGMLLAFGVLCAMLEANKSGKGQVVDAAMVDGAASLMAMIYGLHAQGYWSDEREANLVDGGAPFYDVYECADGKWISVGSIEPQFYALLLQHAGLNDPDFQHQMDKSRWPELKQKVANAFKRKSQAEWVEIMQDTDICFAPVLSMGEAIAHPHNVARQTFVEIDGVPQPAPSPRFSRTPGQIRKGASEPGADTEPALAKWGFSREELEGLRAAGAF